MPTSALSPLHEHSIPEDASLTVGELLRMPALAGCSLLTSDADAKGRRILWTSIHEVPLTSPIRVGELVMTTGAGFREQIELFSTLLVDAAGAGAAAVAVELGVHVTNVPERIIREAESLQLPLATFPWELRFAEVTEIVLGHIIERQQETITQIQQARRLFSTLAKAGDVPRLVAAVEQALHVEITVEHTAGTNEAPAPRRRPEPKDRKSFVEETLTPADASTRVTVRRSRRWRTAVEQELFAIASDALALAVQTGLGGSRESAVEGDSVPPLMSQTHVSARGLERLARELGLNPTQSWSAIFLAFKDRQGPDESAYRSVLAHRLRGTAGLTLWTAEGAAVVLPASAATDAKAERLRARLQADLRHRGTSVFAGVGSIGGSPADVAVSIREARNACRLVLRLSQEGTSLLHDRVTASQALWEGVVASEQTALERITKRNVRPLVEYERRTGVSLIDTLGAVFGCNRNVSAAARVLGINRQTLLHRLDRIQDLTTLRLSEADECFELEIAARIALMDGEWLRWSVGSREKTS